MSVEDSKSDMKEQNKKVSLYPYLSFRGNANEAIDFYVEHLGAKIDCKILYSNGPPPVDEKHKDCVMHASFTFDGNTIMVSDVMGESCGTCTVGDNVTLNLSWQDVEVMTKSFNGLATGGKVLMPLEHQFWGATFGKLVDKFDITWSFNCEDANPQTKKQRTD